MKILILNDLYFPLKKNIISGGLEKALIDQANALSSDCNDVSILSTIDSDVDISPDFSSIRIPDLISKSEAIKRGVSTRRLNIGDKVLSMLREIGGNYDIIISHHSMVNALNSLYLYLKESNMPALVYNHNTPDSGMISVNTNIALKKIREETNGVVLTVSKWSLDRNNNMSPESHDDFHIMQYYECIGISDDEDVYTPENYNILVSRASPYKNIPLALEAAGESGIPLAFYTNSTSCIKSDLKEIDIYKEIADRYKNISIIYDAPYNDIMTVMKSARSHIFTSIIESASYTVFEASCCGIPTVLQYKSPKDNPDPFLRGAPYMFLSETGYYYDCNTYRKRFPTTVSMMRDAILSVDCSLSKRAHSREVMKNHFGIKQYLASLYRFINMSKEK